MTQPRKPPRFQFGLASLLWAMAAVGFFVWASQQAIFWLLVAIAVLMVAVGSPVLLFFAFVYWLNRNCRNTSLPPSAAKVYPIVTLDSMNGKPASRLPLALVLAAAIAYVAGYFSDHDELSGLLRWHSFRWRWQCAIYSPMAYAEAAITGERVVIFQGTEVYVAYPSR